MGSHTTVKILNPQGPGGAVARVEIGIRQTLAMEKALIIFYEDWTDHDANESSGDRKQTIGGIKQKHGNYHASQALGWMLRAGFLEGYTSFKRFGIVTTWNMLGSLPWAAEYAGGWVVQGDGPPPPEIDFGADSWWGRVMTTKGDDPLEYEGDNIYHLPPGGRCEKFQKACSRGSGGRTAGGWSNAWHGVSPGNIGYLEKLNGDNTLQMEYKYGVKGGAAPGHVQHHGQGDERTYILSQQGAGAAATGLRKLRNVLASDPRPLLGAQYEKEFPEGDGKWYRHDPTYQWGNWEDPEGGPTGPQPAYQLSQWERPADDIDTMATCDLGSGWVTGEGFIGTGGTGQPGVYLWTNFNSCNRNALIYFGSVGFLSGMGGAAEQQVWADHVPRINFSSVDAGGFGQIISEDRLVWTHPAGPAENYYTQEKPLVDRVAANDSIGGSDDPDVAIAYKLILGFWGVPGGLTPDLPGTTSGGAAGATAAGAKPKALVKEEALKPFDFQCFLIENINVIAGHKETRNKTREQAGMNDYNKLVTVTSDLGPGNAVSYINNGAKAGQDAKRALLDLCPNIYAMLEPYIKVWRLDYPPVEEGSQKRTPFGTPEMVPIPFASFTSETDAAMIGDSRLGRLPGAGIKSFSWNLDGVQPAEVENNISANLTIYFQSMYDLFRYNLPDDGSGKPQAGIPGQAGYLDLIIGSMGPASTEAADPGDQFDEDGIDPCLYRHEVYDGVDFRILVEVGWSVPENLEGLGFIEQGLVDIENALKETRTLLELQIVRHELNFQQDGSLELSIDYQASLSGLLKTPHANIFEKSKREKNAAKAKYDDRLKELEENYPEEIKDPQTTRGEEYERLLEQKAQTEQNDKIEKYHRFLDGLYKNNKIFAITMDPKELLLVPWGDLTPEQRAARAKRRQSSVPGERGYTSPNQTYSSGTKTGAFGLVNDLAGMQGRTQADVNKVLDQYKTDLGEEYDWLKANWEEMDDFLTVPYFYLGDLIDFVVEYTDITANDAMAMVLADVELIDPLKIFQIKEITVDGDCTVDVKNTIKALAKIDPLRFKKVNKITKKINVGSIPISLDAFNTWFVDHVVKPLRDDYYMLHFIKDVCTDLIGNAYGAPCFGDDFLFDIRFDTSIFNLGQDFASLPRNQNGYRHMANSKYKVDKGGFKEASTDPPIDGARVKGPSLKIIPTIMLYCTDSRPSFSGSERKDFTRGIYHYYLGAACGLLKSVNFSRNDQPYLREAKIQKKGALGAEQLRELYEINMEMVGNTLHKNGQFIYFNPVAVGGGSPEARGTLANWARVLGFGGYFLVQRVSHTIDDTGFNVSINALQQAVQLEPEGGGAGIGVARYTGPGEAAPGPGTRSSGMGSTPGPDSPGAAGDPEVPPEVVVEPGEGPVVVDDPRHPNETPGTTATPEDEAAAFMDDREEAWGNMGGEERMEAILGEFEQRHVIASLGPGWESYDAEMQNWQMVGTDYHIANGSMGSYTDQERAEARQRSEEHWESTTFTFEVVTGMEVMGEFLPFDSMPPPTQEELFAGHADGSLSDEALVLVAREEDITGIFVGVEGQDFEMDVTQYDPYSDVEIFTSTEYIDPSNPEAGTTETRIVCQDGICYDSTGQVVPHP